MNLFQGGCDQCVKAISTDPNGISQEDIMLRKSTLLAVAASAALGLALLSPSVASARGHGGGGGGHGGGMHGGGHGGGMHGGGHGGGHGMHGGHGGRIHIGFRHYHPRWHVRYHRPIWYAPRPVIYSAYAPRVVTPGPCTCLSKEYTPEGAVLFKDRCTNETAMNPPVQQNSEAEPQQQNAQYQQQYVQPRPQAR
jgi:hypothetical protein